LAECYGEYPESLYYYLLIDIDGPCMLDRLTLGLQPRGEMSSSLISLFWSI